MCVGCLSRNARCHCFDSIPFDLGVYLLQVTGEINGLSASNFFELEVLNGQCRLETISPVGTIGPIDYQIGQGTV